jgi:hypothetical protein
MREIGEKMTRETAIEELVKCKSEYDTETAHSIADVVLCQLLIALGYDDVVKEYRAIDKHFV